jgi:hypothetical protein
VVGVLRVRVRARGGGGGLRVNGVPQPQIRCHTVSMLGAWVNTRCILLVPLASAVEEGSMWAFA